MGAELIIFDACEAAALDDGRIQLLRRSLGDQRCREILAEVVFHLTDRLTLLNAALDAGDGAEAGVLASRLAGLAEQVGLSKFARVARSLRDCLRAEDPVAVSAVAARLGRLAEDSLRGVMRHADPEAI
ncbi:Hpt domain-containing protein [Amaricoccus solimangrovi]|uniref:Hpt domain-containing protein n=1 Tax=Amaricoccus solimangrovi TaxID=2589815 RepID=UPI0015E422CA|nr:Hpt domain-containing protein [Amaricoccus solimangrovi]